MLFISCDKEKSSSSSAITSIIKNASFRWMLSIVQVAKALSKSAKILVENSINGDRFGKLISIVHPKIKDVYIPSLS